MTSETELTAAQIANLRKALHATAAQIQQVEELLLDLEVPPSPANKLAMLQVIAINYQAERTKS